MAPQPVSPTSTVIFDTPPILEATLDSREHLESTMVEPDPMKDMAETAIADVVGSLTSAAYTHSTPSADLVSAICPSLTTQLDTPKLAYDRFPSLSSFVPEPQHSEDHREAPTAVVGSIIPRRQRLRPISSNTDVATALNAISSPVNPGPTVPAAASSATSRVPDPLPELPRIPAPLFALLAVLTITGFVFAALVYFINFPADESLLFIVLKKLNLIRDDASPTTHERSIQLLRYAPQSDDPPSASTTGTSYTYSALSSPLSGLSPRNWLLSPSSPSQLNTRHQAPHDSLETQLLSPGPSRRVHLPNPPASEIEWLTQRAAFDEEAPTPMHSPRESSNPLLAASETDDSIHTATHEDAEAVEKTEAGLRHRHTRASQHRQGQAGRAGRVKGWLDSFDGAVGRAVERVVRYVEDEGTEEGLLLPISEEERKWTRGWDEEL